MPAVWQRCPFCTGPPGSLQIRNAELRRQVDQVQKHTTSVSAEAQQIAQKLAVQPLLAQWQAPKSVTRALPGPLYILHQQLLAARLFVPGIEVCINV
jgi:hypothetical protein